MPLLVIEHWTVPLAESVPPDSTRTDGALSKLPTAAVAPDGTVSVPLTVSDPAPAEHPDSSVNVPVTVNDPKLKDPWQVRSSNVSEGTSSTVKEPSEVSVANGLLPTVDAFAYYGGSGLGGDQNPANVCPPAGEKQPFGCHAAGTIPSTGYATTLNQLVNSTAPDKGVGVTLNIPLRNRVAQANQVRSELEYRQAQMRLQQLENQVRIEVRNAQFTLQQNRAAVAAAQAAVEYAQQSLVAEQKKLTAGISTPTLVLQNESLLTTAQSNLISAMAAYEKARLELDRSTGLLLEHSNIQVAEAQRGQVTAMPRVPAVVDQPAGPAKTQN